MMLRVPKGQKKLFSQCLEELVEEGKICCLSGKYQRVRKRMPKEAPDWREGTFISHAKGFGFVEVEEEEEDYYIAAEDTLDAFHHDRVKIMLKPGQTGARREGKIIQIIEHGITDVVGTYEASKNYGFVIPDQMRIDRDIFIPKEHGNGAKDGDKVVVRMTNYGKGNQNPEGRIVEVLGSGSQPGIDVLSIARSYELPMEFSVKALKQADRVPDHVLESDFQGRMDLRDFQTVTIDGEDAKDLDDAISLTKEDHIYHLGVHIADVTNYVQAGSALDREALKRGTSVYLVDRVIPMLPFRLSNGICSLNQGEDRLALSCLVDLDEQGKIIGHKIAETVIRVDRRMTYTALQQILDGDKAVRKEYESFVPLFLLMEELSRKIRSARKKRGAIDFDFPESKVELDDQGHPIRIKAYEHTVATGIIEDFMLTANEAVAKEYFDRKYPFLYRTHEVPDEEKVEKVLAFARKQEVPVVKHQQEITPLEVQQVLAQAEGMECKTLLERLFLRSMKQAKYTTDCIGHFGLASRFYCHFTSPIRRYPDLQIHRIIKDTIRGRMNEERISNYRDFLPDVALKTSSLERRAEEVERETVKLKKAEYMAARIGQSFDGVISGITTWGLYVELPDTIEGLIHVSTLMDDYYIFDEENYQMIGEARHKTYRLGDPVKVQVAEVNMAMKTIDFILQ